MAPRVTRAYAPVSMGNVIVGFDVLGLAMAPLDDTLWGDEARVEDADGDPGLVFGVDGPHAGALPAAPEDNLACAVAREYLALARARGLKIGGLKLQLTKNLPVGSGLGSSASSAVAALTALNLHCGEPLVTAELLGLAGYAERLASGAEHYDNVAPALCGGVCLLGEPEQSGDPALPWRSLPSTLVQLPWPEDLVLVFVTPHYRIDTRDARQALPRQIPLAAGIEQSRRLALFVAALYHEDLKLLAQVFHDDLVEPARAPLLPGFTAARQAALAAGALGCSFSGSGPTTFALARDAEAGAAIGAALQAGFRAAGLDSTLRLARVDDAGARRLETEA